MINETHDYARRSWVASVNGHPEFPLQNLPFGVYRQAPGMARARQHRDDPGLRPPQDPARRQPYAQGRLLMAPFTAEI
jgi:hypothetical protein